jgi:hypothetical protein
MSDYDSIFDPGHVSNIKVMQSQNSEEFHSLLVLGFNLTMRHGFLFELNKYQELCIYPH